MISDSKLRILMIHNYYQLPGGEDIVFRAERDLLRENGHNVLEYTDNNERINPAGQISLALQTIWSWETYSKLRKFILQERPGIAHFHNTFPLISPAAYYACQQLGVPVIQTLHNFRLVCPAATFYRNGSICEKCRNKVLPWPAVLYRCYHNSAIHTGVLAATAFTHNLLRTWHKSVDAYIALTEFSRNKFIEAGFPKEKVFTKPNFISRTQSSNGQQREKFFIYVGRLAPEKGIAALYKAWRNIDVPIYLFGHGSIPSIRQTEKFRLMDFTNRDTIFSYMQQAQGLVFPSEWYEGFPMVIVEAFVNALPVITADIGSQAEIIRNGYAGLHFRSGDPEDLRAKVKWLLHNPEEQLRMSQNARREYEQKYTAEQNYKALINIYSQAISAQKYSGHERRL